LIKSEANLIRCQPQLVPVHTTEIIVDLSVTRWDDLQQLWVSKSQ